MLAHFIVKSVSLETFCRFFDITAYLRLVLNRDSTKAVAQRILPDMIEADRRLSMLKVQKCTVIRA